MCSFVLLFGVAIFSYCMGSFLEIFDSIRASDIDEDFEEKLVVFLGTLRKFNHN